MHALNLDELEPGMILARDVLDRGGRLLYPAGNRIELDHLQEFRARGIKRVLVSGEESDGSDRDAGQEVRKVAQDLIDRAFQSQNFEHPAIQELYRVAVERKTAEILERT